MAASDVRKAAVLLMSLPAAQAVQVIGNLPSCDRDAIVTAIAHVNQAAVDERQSVCNEFAAAGRFDFLVGADRRSLAALLSDERPQTIAVVAAQLPAAQAVEMLAELPPELQNDVVGRIATRGPISRILLCDLKQGVRDKWDARQAA